MKFTNGEWLPRPGVIAHNCEQIREVRLSKDNRSLWLFCVGYRENERSMEGAVLEVTITAPGEDMLRLQTVHHKGEKTLVYPINYGYIPGVLGGDGEELDVYVLGIDTKITVKAGMELLGLCSEEVRLPLAKADERVRAKVAEALRGLGMLS